MTEANKRQARRIDFSSRIRIRTGDNVINATADARNISLRGIYLVPEQKAPVDTPCTLEITLEGESATMTFTVEGTICRHDEKGTAIAFTDMDMDTFLHLTNLIHLHGKTDSTDPSASPCP